MARKDAVMNKSFKEVSAYFDKQNPQNNLKVINDAEKGIYTDKSAPALKSMQDLLNDKYKTIEQYKNGGLSFIDNYFPHIWKDPEKAGIEFAKIYGKKPLEGSKSFLKQRKIPTTQEGLDAYSGHDPDGNVFDLAQRRDDTRSNMYAETAAENWNQDRYLNKFAIRTLNPDRVAEFYADVFDLAPVNRPSAMPSHHLSDGRITLQIMPWAIEMFEGMAIKRPGPDHIGFRVESIEALKADVAKSEGANQYLAVPQLGGGKEAEVRRSMLARSATGKYQLCDPDGTWIDVTDE